MQNTGNWGSFPQGKRATTVRNYPAPPLPPHPPPRPLCAVVSCCHTTGCKAYTFTTDGYGSFNVRTQTNMHKNWFGGTETNWLSPCPASGSNLGFSDLNADSLTPSNGQAENRNPSSFLPNWTKHVPRNLQLAPLSCLVSCSNRRETTLASRRVMSEVFGTTHECRLGITFFRNDYCPT